MSLTNQTRNWQEVVFFWENVPEIENEALLDYHSMLNLLNVISMLLELQTMDTDPSSKIKNIQDQVRSIARHISENPEKAEEGMLACSKLNDDLDRLLEAYPTSKSEHSEYHSILTEISKNMRARVQEFLERSQNPNGWVNKHATEIEESLKQFFSAVEKNSKGRYRFVYDITEQGPNTYMISFVFEPNRHGYFEVPPVLLDTLRDLAANSRKFTAPGGQITIKLLNTDDQILLEVEDNGQGIPSDEIRKVVEYGFRASNTRNIRTMGGGFGLTKALSVATRFRGQMKIASELGQGTIISITIPAKGKGKA